MTVYGPLTLDAAVFGRERILIDKKDVTFLRNVPTQIQERSHANPYGWRSCTLVFPQMTGHEGFGIGGTDLSMIRKGVNVDIQRIKQDGTIADHPLFEGFITEITPHKDEDRYYVTVSCLGYLYQADLVIRKPRAEYLAWPVLDIGVLVPRMFNKAVLGRRYRHVTLKDGPTGIEIKKRGSLSQSVMNFASEILATAWTRDGTHWTVMDRAPGRRAHMVKIETTGHDYTISYGAQGVTVDVRDDLVERPNVIYGSGVNDEGGAWSNYHYPYYHPDQTPLFPLDLGSDFSPGSGTTGFQGFSDKMRESGYPSFDSQDTYRASDEDDVTDFQDRAGITVDGIVGRQTWNALFQPGSGAGHLGDGIYLPLAKKGKVEPHLYNGDGEVIGDNPNYDPDVLRVEKWVNYGEGVSKRDARRFAKYELDRTGDKGWIGTITLRTNPEECHRKMMKAGKNIKVRHFNGSHEGELFHIADFTDNMDGSVTLTVDTEARDYMTLQAIRDRNKESRQHPARGILRRAHRGGQMATNGIRFDAESPAGRVPKHAVQGGFWSVIPILFGQWGTIVRTVYNSSPNAEYFIGVFSGRVTPNQLLSWVGNPFDTAEAKPWDTSYDTLAEHGLLMAYGVADSPAGYFPRDKTDQDAELTGRWEDDMSWDWATETSKPILWIAEFADRDTYLHGRFYNAPMDM